MGDQRGKNQDKKMQSLPRKGKKCRFTRANEVAVGFLFLFWFWFVFVCFFSIIEILISQTRPPKQTTCISCLHLSCMLQPGESPLQTLKLEQLHEVQLYI